MATVLLVASTDTSSRTADAPGEESLSLMVDRRSGQTVSVTAFENRDAAGLVRRSARSLREQFAQAMGARIIDVAEMDLDLAHLHVPERA